MMNCYTCYYVMFSKIKAKIKAIKYSFRDYFFGPPCTVYIAHIFSPSPSLPNYKYTPSRYL